MFPWSVGALSRCRDSEAYTTEKWPPSWCFPTVCDSPYTWGWQWYLLGGRRGIPRDSVFRLLTCTKHYAFHTSELLAYSKGLNSRVRAVCLRAHSKPCKHIPRSQWYYPWGIRPWECVWEDWVPYWGHPVEGTLHLQWAPGEELGVSPLLQKSQSREPS